MAGTARNLNQADARARWARMAPRAERENRAAGRAAHAGAEGTAPAPRATSSSRARSRPRGAGATAPAVAARAGKRGALDRWQQIPPHVRLGSIGAILVMLGGLGYVGLLARADAASPLAPVGQVLYALAGWGAFPLMALLVVEGGLCIAEGMARRALLRSYLFAAALALWLVAVLASQLFFGHATGGLVGVWLTAPVRRVPGIVVRGIAVALGAVLTLILAGVGVREVGRGLAWAVRGSLHRAPQAARPATGPSVAAVSRQPKRSPRLPPPPAPHPTEEPAETPARLLLPTAGFPLLEVGTVEWELPPLDLFDAPARAAPSASAYAEELARRLEQALAALRLEAEVRREDISAGPTVIRLGIRPAERPLRDARGATLVGRDGQPATTRTPVSHILRAQHELAAALGVHQLRMEAPAPGEATVGVEVPRPGARPVSLYELLLSDGFQRVAAMAQLPVALGRDTRGQARALDLAGAPHLLLAGRHGAEVVAGLHLLLASLLSRATPGDARLLPLDPGRRALAAYDDLPHLLMPTVTEAGAAVSALHRMLEEAERRRQLFTHLGVRDLAAYQHLAEQEGELEWLPALVVAVAELDDLAPAGAEAERSLCRLAQVGRAVGIHLLLATEHPTPMTLTPAVRARVPARLALAVASAAESRVILDAPGAECLAGHGDLLFLSGETARLERIAGGVVSDEEIGRLARFWRRQVVATPAYGTPVPAYGMPPLGRAARSIGGAASSASALDLPTIPSQADPPAAAPARVPPSGSPPESSWLPPLPLRPHPSAQPAQPARAGDVGRSTTPSTLPLDAHAEEWRSPLPEGWTDGMLEDMMQQIRAVIAQGRTPRPPVSPGNPMEEE